MFALPSFRPFATAAISALSLGACEMSTQPGDAAFIAEHAAALQEVPLAPRAEARWLIELEVVGTKQVEIRVPVDLSAPPLERVSTFKSHSPRQPLRDRFGMAGRQVEVFQGALELSLVDATSGELLGVALAEDTDTALAASIDNPCDARPRCLRRVILTAKWLGDEAVLVRPDIEIAGQGGVDFAR